MYKNLKKELYILSKLESKQNLQFPQLLIGLNFISGQNKMLMLFTVVYIKESSRAALLSIICIHQLKSTNINDFKIILTSKESIGFMNNFENLSKISVCMVSLSRLKTRSLRTPLNSDWKQANTFWIYRLGVPYKFYRYFVMNEHRIYDF